MALRLLLHCARKVGESLVGVPDMREMWRPLTVGQHLVTQATIEHIKPVATGLSVGTSEVFDNVVLAIPAPQAAAILQRSAMTMPAAVQAVSMIPALDAVAGPEYTSSRALFSVRRRDLQCVGTTAVDHRVWAGLGNAGY